MSPNPLSPPATDTVSRQEGVTSLLDFLRDKRRICVLTGAGISLNSGIPTYRDAEGNWTSRTPIQHQEFMASDATRRRYWTRSFVGWPAMAAAEPNGAHRALARLEATGLVAALVTQNVDRLHQKASHQQVIDLHGRLDQVICMDCGAMDSRAQVQQWLETNNPHLHGQISALAPDGDADAADSLIARTAIPVCGHCGGIIKPNVVFFGDSVAKPVVEEVFGLLDACDGLLVVGSSLMVYSSFRFCRHADAQGLPMACINEGRTRADAMFQLKVAADCAGVLDTVADRLAGQGYS